MKMISIVSTIFALLMNAPMAHGAAQPSLLHQWAKKDSPTKVKQYEAVQKERRKSINWDGKDDKGLTPLMIAVANGNSQMVIFLLEHGVDPSIVDNNGKTAFDYAPGTETGQLIKAALIKKTNTKDGQTLLTQTIKNGDLNHFNMLITHKDTDINKSNSLGQTPLHVAVSAYNERPENKVIMAELLKMCALQVNAQDNKGNTPLHYAAELGNLELVMMLTGAGAQATIANKDGKKPAQIIGKKNAKMDKIEKKAIEEQLKVVEQSPINSEKAKQHCRVPSGAQNGNAAQGSASAGNTPNVKTGQEQTKIDGDQKALQEFDQHGQTMLTEASGAGNFEDVIRIIGMGASVNAPDQNINTPLLAAVKYYRMPINGFRHYQIIAFLLEKGASILIYDRDGKTPLHYAVEHENKPAIHLLLIHLARDPNKFEIINSQDKNGDTPLHYAAATSSFEIVHDLLENGADREIKNKAGKCPRDMLGTKISVSENTRTKLAKNNTKLRRLLGIDSDSAPQTHKRNESSQSINQSMDLTRPSMSAVDKNNAPGHTRNRTESITDKKQAVEHEAEYPTVTFDDEEGTTHIEVPLDDE